MHIGKIYDKEKGMKSRPFSHCLKMLCYLAVMALAVACNTSRLIPDNKYMLDNVQITSDAKSVNAESLAPYIRQRGNSKWFSIFKIPLSTYALAGKDSTKWINKTLKRIGEEPVLYDSAQAKLSIDDLTKALHNLGYMHATVDMTAKKKSGKKIDITYKLHPGTPYYVSQLHWDIQDTAVAKVLGYQPHADSCTNVAVAHRFPFTVTALDDIRKQVTSYLNDNGYYQFHKDFIRFDADSVSGSPDIAVTLHLLPYRTSAKNTPQPHSRYRISDIHFIPGDSTGFHLRYKVMQNAVALRKGEYFSTSDLQNTYNNFGRMGAVRFTNITFREHPDSALLDANIKISTYKPSTIAFQPEGTNTAGDLGVAGLLTYQNRNIFRGSELFSISLRGAFEAITGLEGYENHDYEEYSVESRLQFPRFVAPFLSKAFMRRSSATSELSASWNLQNRPECHRRVFSAAWRYKWSNPRRHTNYNLDVIDLNYVYMPWISPTFKHDYIDSTSNRNAILRYNYENLLIMKVGFGLNYNDGTNSLRTNIETAGNLLRALSGLGFQRNDEGQYQLFNTSYAQYVKFDFDGSHLFQIDPHNQLVLHMAFGIAYPYGNSKILPFEKRYFSGGPNSVRGWSVRELGPGKYHRSDGRIDFINQTGDVKLDLNAEYRTHLFWKFDGAAFIDAGNIWTLRNYAEQPGGQFKINQFYKQIAVAYGLGLRLNFSYFILRFDLGMKAVNPAYETSREHYPILHPSLGRDFKFHFAVGLPF